MFIHFLCIDDEIINNLYEYFKKLIKLIHLTHTNKITEFVCFLLISIMLIDDDKKGLGPTPRYLKYFAFMIPIFG